LLRTQLAPRGLDLLDSISARTTWRPNVKVRWFDEWAPVLDDALASLPELEFCKHSLFSEIARTPGPTKKRLALVTQGGEPIAVACIRRRKTFWEPVLENCIPLSTFPTKPGALGVAVDALGLEVRIGGYPEDPSPLRPTSAEPYAIFRADLTGDYEAHWRAKHRMTEIRQARKRTATLKLRWDEPGDVAWIVRAWKEMWKDDPEQQAVVAGDDRLIASQRLMSEGRLHCALLLDDDHPVGGVTLVPQGSTLYLHCMGRDLARGSHSLGTRLHDECFAWGVRSGYKAIDFGGGVDYKRWWAPHAADRYQLVFEPKGIALAKSLARRARALRKIEGDPP